MAGTLHHRLPHLLLLVVFSVICSTAFSDPHSPSASPPFHHNGKPLPGHNPSLPPQSHDKPLPIPNHKPPHDHVKPPTSPPHPLDLPHPSPLSSKPHPPPLVEKHQPPKPVHDGRNPSPPGKPRYPIKPPPGAGNSNNIVHQPQVIHMIPSVAPHDQHPNPTPYKSQPPPTPIDEHRPPSPLNPKTPLRRCRYLPLSTTTPRSRLVMEYLSLHHTLPTCTNLHPLTIAMGPASTRPLLPFTTNDGYRQRRNVYNI